MNADGATLPGNIKANVEERAYLTTDEHTAYRGLRGNDHKHYAVSHGAGEYVRHYSIRTNGIKSFRALLKRGHYGV